MGGCEPGDRATSGMPVAVAKVGLVAASADAIGLRRRVDKGWLGQTIPDNAAATAK